MHVTLQLGNVYCSTCSILRVSPHLLVHSLVRVGACESGQRGAAVVFGDENFITSLRVP